MKIGIINNCLKGETRVASTPKTSSLYIKDGFEVFLQKGAGELSGFCDEEYQKEGVIALERKEVLECDIILSVLPPKKEDLASFRAGQWLICDLTTFDEKADLKDLVNTDIGAIDLGKIPRISRAQTMDILSSQSLIAGYKAATDALHALKQTAPLLMTSAGTLPPVKALVIGAGVAGLQAVSVLKRMGANVIATDIREESKAEIQSVGAKFSSNIQNEISTSNIIICSAFTHGKKAPLLLKKDQIKQMPENSVLIDMAQGNIEENFSRNDIVFIKDKHLERKLPTSASLLFSNNVYSFLKTFDYLSPNTNYEDEILQKTLICSDGFLRSKIK